MVRFSEKSLISLNSNSVESTLAFSSNSSFAFSENQHEEKTFAPSKLVSLETLIYCEIIYYINKEGDFY